MTDKSWKAFERRVAKMFNGKHIPVTGERNGADVGNAMFGYQVKLGRKCPAYLREWLSGIVENAELTGRVGVVVWKPKHARDEDALVILRAKDWRDLHGG